MSHAKEEFQKLRADVLQKMNSLSLEYSEFAVERIKIQLEWYELLIYPAKMEEKRQGLLGDLTSTNIFAVTTTNLNPSLYCYDRVFQSSTVLQI
jgi:hypothetical protein